MDKSGVNHLLQAFHEIYESSQLQDLDQKKILERFVNFSKTYVFHESEELRMKKKKASASVYITNNLTPPQIL